MEKSNLTKSISLHSTRTIGAREVIRHISKGGRFSEVIIAKDIDHSLYCRLVTLCKNAEIPMSFASSKTLLGQAVDIEVDCAIIGLGQ